MEFRHFEHRRPVRHTPRAGRFPTMSGLACLIFGLGLIHLTASPQPPRHSATPPRGRVDASARSEWGMYFAGYLVSAYERAKLDRATHIGILRNRVVTDPPPSVMEGLQRQCGFLLRPASELADAGSTKAAYRLVTLENLRWETGYRAIADGTLYDGNGGVFGMRFVKPYYDGPYGLTPKESYFQVVNIVTQDSITIRSKTGEPVTLSL